MRTLAYLLVLASVAACGGGIDDGAIPDGGRAGSDATVARDGASEASRDGDANVARDGASDGLQASQVCRKGGGQAITLATGQIGANSIAVSDGYVYWTGVTPDLLRVPVGGGTVATVGGPAGGHPLVVDSHSAYTTNVAQDLVRLALDGGDETLVVPGNSSGSLEIAVQDSTVYWIYSPYVTPDGVIGRASSGGVLVTLATGPEPSMLGIADGRLYWSQSSDHGDSGLVSVPLQGGQTVTVSGARVADLGLGGSYTLIQGDDLYSVFGFVQRVPLDGGRVSTLSAGPGLGTIQAVVSDPNGIYWATYDSIRCVPLGQSEPVKPVTLGSGVNSPHSNATIAQDDAYIYWADQNHGIIGKTSKL